MSSLDPSILRFYSFNGRTCVPLTIEIVHLTFNLDQLDIFQSEVKGKLVDSWTLLNFLHYSSFVSK